MGGHPVDLQGISTRAPRTEGDTFRRTQDTPSGHFNPRPPHGGRRVSSRLIDGTFPFQPAPPARRATVALPGGRRALVISTRAPRTEGDTASLIWLMASWNFNPRPPHGGRHPAHREQPGYQQISTRAPRTEGDSRCCHDRIHQHISTRAPRTEGDSSTRLRMRPTRYFNPRPPHGGRHEPLREQLDGFDISTRAPRTEGDSRLVASCCSLSHFNPRPPHGGRHERPDELERDGSISTRAPRTEGDESATVPLAQVHPFQPAPPARRATPAQSPSASHSFQFQPAPPARRATHQDASTPLHLRYFNPRPPHGGRPATDMTPESWTPHHCGVDLRERRCAG